MAKPSPLIVLFVLATAMVNLTVHRAIDAGASLDGARGFLLGFTLAQLVLLTLWLVFGRWNVLIRILLVLAMCGFLADLNASVTSSTNLDEWLGAIAFLGFTMAAPLTFLRALGMAWVDDAGPIARETASPRTRRRQFSLGTLFVWFTGSCVVFAAMRGIGFPWRFALQVIVYCLGFAVVGLLSLGAVFGDRRVPLRLFVVAVASPTIGWLMGLPWEESLLVSVICAVEVLGTVCGAAVLRMSGLHLRWGAPNPVRSAGGPD